MKKILFALVAASLLVGCATSRIAADPRIVIDPSAKGLVEVLTVDYGATPGSNPVVALTVRSTGGSTRKLEQRTVWFDSNGAVIDSVLSNWKALTLYENETKDFRTVAPRSDVKGFRIEIRKAP